MSDLENDGFALLQAEVPDCLRSRLRAAHFQPGRAGERCLLDEPAARETALHIARHLIRSGHLPASAVAIQAIAFDKTPDANWKVTWHQDLMFPFAGKVTTPGFDLACVKGGIDYARPPAEFLRSMLAVRLHLDDCDETNGPLRVCPGTHQRGILPVEDIPGIISGHPPVTCTAGEGEALLMRPLLLHASSQAHEPKHRRVLHIVYASENSPAEPWHRAISNLQ